jgi:hypothetical protein
MFQPQGTFSRFLVEYYIEVNIFLFMLPNSAGNKGTLLARYGLNTGQFPLRSHYEQKRHEQTTWITI